MADENEFYNELKKVDSRNRIFSVSFYGENSRESLYSTMNLKKAAIYYSENYDKVDHFTIDFCSNPYGGCNFVILDNLDKLISYNNENNKYKKSNKMNEGIFNFNKFDMPLKEMDSYLGGQGKFMFSKETNTYIYRGEELLQYGNSVYMNGINTGIGPSNGMVKIPRNSNYACTTREEFNRMKKELSAWLSNKLPRILSAKNDIKRTEEWADAQGAELQRKIERNRRLIAQDQQDMQDSNYRKEANRAASYMGANPLREGAGKKQRIRINERDLKKMVAESTKKILNEINGYNQTMQNAGNKFNQNTFMGRVRSKINPQKYQQYQRIQQNAGQMGANATDTLNTAYDNMGDATVNFDHTAPDYTNYYMQKNPNAQTPYFANGYDTQGEQQFNKDYSTELGWQKKYGTGGRIAKPLYGNDSTIDKERIPYNQQRQAIKNGSIQEDTDLAQVWCDKNYDSTYRAINENRIRKIVSESIKKVLGKTR